MDRCLRKTFTLGRINFIMDFNYELKIKQDMVNNCLKNMISSKDAPGSIVDAMNYSLMAGGKRIRPILSISVCKSLGGSIDDILEFACAIELIHTYSLIHDDLPAMDNDDLRRGKPTNHKVFGEAKAILAGDGLLNYAFEIMLEIALNKSDVKYLEAAKTVARASGIRGMIGGQVIDIECEGKTIDIDTLYLMHSKKTGALIEASCLTGCIIAGRKDMIEAVREYSRNLGIAFQIVDDILDYVGDTKKLGKNTGVDMEKGKSTFVSILGIEKSKELALSYSQKAKDMAIYIDKSSFLLNLTEYLLYREN